MKFLFENWRQYLKEGKAIAANPSIRAWASNAFRAYKTAAEKGELKFDQPFFSGTVEGYDGEQIEVTAILLEAPDRKYSGAAAVTKETLGTEKQTIKLYQSVERQSYYDPDIFEPLFLHELVHIIDPKFKLDPEEHSWHRTHKDPVKYYNSPHEQDAMMRQSVEDIKRYYGKITKNMIKNYKPESHRPWEKVWHETNPKAWRKFLNTLYAEVEGESDETLI